MRERTGLEGVGVAVVAALCVADSVQVMGVDGGPCEGRRAGHPPVGRAVGGVGCSGCQEGGGYSKSTRHDAVRFPLRLRSFATGQATAEEVKERQVRLHVYARVACRV